MTPAELRARLAGLSVLAVALQLDRKGELLTTLAKSGGLRIRPESGELGVRYTFIPLGTS